MWVAFKNIYNQSISVAIMKQDTDACGGEGGNWATAGWWLLNPGESKTAFWTTNQYSYYYAEAQDGVSWGDSNGPAVYVTSTRFNSCLNIGSSNARIVTMNKVDVGWPPAAPFTHTVNLKR
jgi:uncharacterized membrane protein